MVRVITARSFVLSEVLAFLKLHDAVHLLTALMRLNLPFTPSQALWKEAFRTALHRRIRCRASHTHTWQKHPDTNFTEFTTFMRFLKATPTEVQETAAAAAAAAATTTTKRKQPIDTDAPHSPTRTVTVVQREDGTQCHLQSGIGQALTVPCNVCVAATSSSGSGSGARCGKVVLWACPVCLLPPPQCHAHGPTCLSCCESVCRDCVFPDTAGTFRGAALCKSCGFVCATCGTLRTDDAKLACAGPAPGLPCVAQRAPVCRSAPCAADFAACGGCARTACGACVVLTPCGGGCSKSFCPPCADALRACAFCPRAACARCAKRTMTVCGLCEASACGPCAAAAVMHSCGVCRAAVCVRCGGMDTCDSCGKRCCGGGGGGGEAEAGGGDGGGCSVWVQGGLWDGCPSALQCTTCARSSSSKWPWS